MTAAMAMDVIARLPDCGGQARDAVSAKTQEKLENALRLFKIPKSECPDLWIRLPPKWPKSWANVCGSSREKFIRTPITRIVMGKTIRGSSIGAWMWKSTKLGVSVCS